MTTKFYYEIRYDAKNLPANVAEIIQITKIMTRAILTIVVMFWVM